MPKKLSAKHISEVFYGNILFLVKILTVATIVAHVNN